ncbi:MAG: hypothetical protein IPL60_02975 [Ardenticatenia bacterium]|nr:hypothetical protein [Ardenticatenia bacterium]
MGIDLAPIVAWGRMAAWRTLRRTLLGGLFLSMVAMASGQVWSQSASNPPPATFVGQLGGVSLGRS